MSLAKYRKIFNNTGEVKYPLQQNKDTKNNGSKKENSVPKKD